MKKSFMIFGLCLLTDSLAFAEDFNNKMIKERNWSGSAAAAYSSNGGTRFFARPSAEYFLTGHISLGGSLDYEHSHGYTSYGLGPSATFYFLEAEKTVFFYQQRFLYNQVHTDFDGYSESHDSFGGQSTIGMNYFLTPSVAVGPRISYDWSSRYSNNLTALFGIQAYF